MRAAICHDHGPPERLSVETVPTPTPGRAEVLVRIAYAAVNFPDVLIIADEYQVSVPTPFTPGSEFSGTVVSVGEEVIGLKPGDEVFGAVFHGAFADHVIVPAGAVRPVPPGVPLARVAGFWVAHATAYHALRSVAEVNPGDWVVVLGAAGGVGLAAVEIATLMGANVIAAASNPQKLGLCLSRGAVATVDYSSTDLRDGIRSVVPAGADVVLDPVGGPLAERALRATRWGGRFVTVGFASGEIPRIPLNLVLLKGAVVRGFEIRTFTEHAPELARRDEQELLGLLAAGTLIPHVSAVHPLDDVAVALRTVADRRSSGKVLIAP